jgi:cyclopropane fatty-acyl-phospholipid synthase-like methyltransferase
MTISKKCNICSSGNLETLIYGYFSINKCNVCGFQYIPNNEKYIGDKYFENYFDKRDAKENLILNKLRLNQYKIDVEFLKKYISSESRILDVGCSSGVFSFEIYKQCNPEYILGIDIDPSAIKFANENYAHIVDFKNIDLLRVEKNRKFDLIIFRGTFQYLDKTLHESIKHLKELLTLDGKIVLFSLPSTDSFVYHLLKEKWALFHPEMSLMFNEKSIRHLFQKSHFKVDHFLYPYPNDAYSNLEDDYKDIEKVILGKSFNSPPFWGALMQLVISRNE